MMIVKLIKNIKETIAKEAKIYMTLLLTASRHSMTGPSPSGCISAAESLYMKEMTNIFNAGKAAINKMRATPAIPTVFFSSKDAFKTVSAASVNIRPTTGTKFPATNFAVLIATPSATAEAAP